MDQYIPWISLQILGSLQTGYPVESKQHEKTQAEIFVKDKLFFSSVLGDAWGCPVLTGASQETVEPLDLSNAVLVLNEGKSKTALPVGVSVTEADISPFLMRSYSTDSHEPCALAWRHWPQSKRGFLYYLFFASIFTSEWVLFECGVIGNFQFFIF